MISISFEVCSRILMIDCRECLVNMMAYHRLKAPQLYHVSYCLSSYKVHLVISISFEVRSPITMIDCRECLVNMTAYHWVKAPQLCHVSYCLSTS